MVDSELGEIPKGWKLGKLGDFVDVIKGCSYSSEDLKESDIALVTLKSINRGGGFNQEGYKEYVGEYKDTQILEGGEIVIAQTDITQKAEVIGRPAIVNSLGRYKKLIASLDLQIVRPKKELNKSFLYYLLETNDFHYHAISYTNGTTVLHLNKNAVPNYSFILPPLKQLKLFDETVNLLIKKNKDNDKQILALSQIRDSLLPKLMSGQIRVPIEAKV
jgi:type I restriction enzyme S subunit